MITSYIKFSSKGLKGIKYFICVCVLALSSIYATAQISGKYTYSYVGNVAYASIGGTVLQSTAAGVSVDAVFPSIAIGFTFNFNCVTYTTCGISNNGFIWFGSGSPSATNYLPLSSTTGETGSVDGIISVAGSNITGTTATAALRYITSGIAPNRTFTVEWKSVLEGGVERCDHEIRLTETSNKIELIGFDNSYLVSGTANIQRGVRGSSVSDFKNLKTSGGNNLCSPLAGTLNTDVCQILATSACGYMTSASSQAINHTFSFTGSCCTPPTTGASLFGYSNVVVNGASSTADFSFVRGNGDGGVIAIVKAGSAPSAPTNGTVYTGSSTVYGSGTSVGGGFLVYDATGSGSGTVNVSLSSLTNGVTYYVGVYEYNSIANCYVGSALSGNIPIPVCSPPSTQASGNSVSNIQTNQADINWTGNGNGDDVIVFFKQGSAISTDPTQTTNYNANAGFGLGDQIGATGARAVYKGTGSSVTVTGLTTNITYYYAIYARNSTTNCYSVPPVTGSFTTTNGPMSLSAYVVTHPSLAAVTPNTTNVQILQLRMDCGTGTAPALVMNQLFFTTAATNGGTTNPADIANAKVYYTGTSSTFATTTQFGSTVVSPNGTFIVSGSTTLVPGSNYFWLTYDIVASPTIGDFVDAKLSTIDVGAILTPSGDPAGNRQITLTYCTPTAMGGSACSAAGNIFISNANLSGTTFYSGGTCTSSSPYYANLSGSVTASALTGNSYTLTLNSSAASSAYGTTYAAWIDWDNNGTFGNNSNENIIISSSVYIAGGGALTVTSPSFVPPSAGSFRMRVTVWGGQFGLSAVTGPCSGSGSYYGEWKDFTINVAASSLPMTYSSSTTTQNTLPVPPNLNNQQIVGLQVVTTGSLTPIGLTSLTFNTNGSTNITGDATNARVFYTGTNGTYSAVGQFGSTVANPNGSYTLTGSQTLSSGTNYFWIAYDVPLSATLGNLLDAECTSIVVDGSTYTPSITAPGGARPINLVYCVPSAGATGCSLGGDDVITAVSLNGAGSTFNFTGGTCLTPYPNNYQINPYTGDVNQGGSYTTTMIKSGSSFGARFIAWVDWDNDGNFTGPNDKIMDVTQNGASATGLSFTVPGTAAAGGHRMRTWIGYTGTIVISDVASVTTGCEVLNGASNQGEIRDFTINVLGGCTAPVIGACPANITQCDNHTATWTDPTATGTTPTIDCSPASGSTFATGTTTVTCTAINACGSDDCSFDVTINETPVIGACPSDIEQCDNHIATWTNPTASGSPAATVTCVPASGSTFATGTTVVTCTANNSCGNSSCTFSVTMNESPVIGACPADITTCNNVVTFATPSSTGTPAATVTCSPASGSTFADGVTTVTCTASNACGNSSCSFDVNVQTSSVAATSVTSSAPNDEVCLGSNVTLTANGGSLGVGAVWNWYEGGCGTGAILGSGTTLTITPATSGTHTYFVRAQGTCNTTPCETISIAVKTAPPGGTIHITGSPEVGCVGSTDVVSVNSVFTATYYRWSCSTGGILFDGQPSPYDSPSPTVNITYTALPAGGNSGWSICVFPGNACGSSNTICTWIRATISRPGNLTGSIIGCPNTSETYSCGGVSGAVSYQWSITGNATITGNGSQTVTVNYGAGFTTGTLCVHAQTSCGYNSADLCMTVSNVSGVPGTVSGNGNVCPNGSSTFSIAAVPGATSYIWTCTVPGSVVTNNGTSCSVAFPSGIPGGSLVCVSSVGQCGTASTQRCRGIASGIPITPGVISGPNGGQCSATGVSYTISPVAGATGYLWTVNNGAVIQGPNNLSGITVDFPNSFNTVTLSVTASNICGTGGTRTLVVGSIPATPPAIVGNNSVCNGNVEFYSTTGSAGATGYLWVVPPTASILGGQNSSSIIVLWGSTGGNITVNANNICGNSGLRTFPVTVTCRQSQLLENLTASSSVYPNPTNGKLNIRFTLKESDQLIVEAADLTGRVLMTEMLSSTEGVNVHELDLFSFAKGVYIIHLKGKEIDEMVKVSVN